MEKAQIEQDFEIIDNEKNKTSFLYYYKKFIKWFLPNLRINNLKSLSIIVSPLITFIVFFFYYLGYLFLYGYYFGGDKLSLLKVATYIIPFNFKSVILVGSIFFSIFLTTVHSFINLYIGLTKIRFKTFLYGVFFLAIMLFIDYLLLVCLVGSYSQYSSIFLKHIGLWCKLLLALLLLSICIAKKIKEVLFGLLNGFIFTLVIMVIYSFITKNTEVNDIYLFPLLAFIILSSIILVFLNKNKIFFLLFPIIYFVSWWSIISFEVSYLPFRWIFKKTGSSLFTVASMFIVFFLISILIIKVLLKFINFEKISNIIVTIIAKIIAKLTKRINEIPKFAGFIICFILILIIGSVVSNWILLGANSINSEVVTQKNGFVLYYDGKENKSIEGEVVAQSGNTIYISTKDNRLEIVNSEFIRTTSDEKEGLVAK